MEISRTELKSNFSLNMVSKSDSFYFLVATFQQMKQLFSRVDGDENFIKLI